MDAMMKRLQSIEERYNEINEEMMSPEIVSDPKRLAKLGKEQASLKQSVEAYEELNRSLPNVGTRVKTPDGLNGEVQNVSVLKQKVRVIVTLDNDEKEVREYMAAELKFRKERKRDHGKQEDDKELKALEAMEKKEGKSKI